MIHSRLFSLTAESESDHWGLLRTHLENISRLKDQGIHQELLSSMVKKFVALEQRVDELLKNTLPAVVAEEIKYLGTFAPRSYDCTILFSDVVGFTRLAERLSSGELVEIIDAIFRLFDRIVQDYQGTKIKTIGDSYMAVFGAPLASREHAQQAVSAAMKLVTALADFNLERFGLEQERYFQCRLGIHSGTVTAGVVGQDRMQFDVFGDTVNIASRFESAGEAGRVNISEETRLRLPAGFVCEDRGEVPLKNKGRMKAYFVVQEQQEQKKDTGHAASTPV
ncbi:MAG: adenylate/guanylate cyclase domain-containing protein [Desulfobulbaceae bacterium]|nr:adenylate/guanylate cyclase domain-containing protein [Desulfobulbaceae bacterium]HIJ89837.1 adenylate/guanylate cyclase domain-containing protein [Deltaproteobacteria bacterium]